MDNITPASSEPKDAAALPATAAAPHTHVEHHQSPWYFVLCLTGVDYFSTLAYQPSIAFSAAGILAPLATMFLVLITLFGAVPIYRYVAGQSHEGQGSLKMLEHLLSGWLGKLMILSLLGFAATDFVITITLSAADATEHLLHNPLFHGLPFPFNSPVLITLCFLLALSGIFLIGFREVIGVAVAVVIFYLAINLILICFGVTYIFGHPELLSNWMKEINAGEWEVEHAVFQGKGLLTAILVSVLYFPKLALGLSGFETGVAIMPLVKGAPDDDPANPKGRISAARTMLLTAALIMSVMLIGSSLLTTLLIPHADLHHGGPATNRALAYLAHGDSPHQFLPFAGEIFGTIYDLSTIVILWFAGASAFSGLLNLIPRYLPRYGMAPTWINRMKPMVLVILGTCVLVTIIFQADVESQGGAYATGVMVLMVSACLAVTIDRWRHHRKNVLPLIGSMVITLLFIYTTITIIIEKPDGLIISIFFIVAIVFLSLLSRFMRAGELRTVRFQYADQQTQFLWETLKYLDIPVLVPHRPFGRSIDEKEKEIRARHHITDDIPIVFLEANVGDPSDFYQEPLMKITSEGGRFLIQLSRVSAIAPVIAEIAIFLSQESPPLEVHFGWSDENPLQMNLRFLLFGEGNVPWLVYELLQEAKIDPSIRPRVIIG
jgi:hypothetical protein